jgi:hypothetical protein
MGIILRLVVGVAACLLLPAGGTPASPQPQYQPGVFVATSDGPVELTAFAVQAGTGVREISRDGRIGILRMEHGSLENAPEVPDVQRVLVNLPSYFPAGVMVATTAFFGNERAERRDLPIATQRLGMWTFDVRAADLERPEAVARLLDAVRASDDEPGYFFVVIGGHEMMPRFYPFRVR